MDAMQELAAGMLPDSGSGSPAADGLCFGCVTKALDPDGVVEIQGDGLTLDADDLRFAAGLRQSLRRGNEVLLLRQDAGQTYYVLVRME